MAKETEKGAHKAPNKADKTDKLDKTEKAEASHKKAPAETKKAAPKEAKAAKAEASGGKADEKAKPAKKKGPPSPTRPKLNPRTYFAKTGEVASAWKLIDVTGQPLGRVSSFIATTLMGKLNPRFTPNVVMGDFVVVVNAEKILLTGNKLNDKVYQYHTNYPGGLKTFTAKQILESHPERLVKLAVYRMLPKSKGHVARECFKRLKVYQGAEHPHKAQQPVPVTLPQFRHTERV